jgi:hypothetical protein
MKRLTFKKPFNGIGKALELIPETYKVNDKVFQMTDGNENYEIRWEGTLNEGKGVILKAENKSMVNEDMKHMKHLMGYKSEDTLGTLKGAERLSENSSFSDIWDKTKALLSETNTSKEVITENATAAAGMGFVAEVEENDGEAPVVEAEENCDECDEEINEVKDRFDEIFEGLDDDDDINESDDEEADDDLDNSLAGPKSANLKINK